MGAGIFSKERETLLLTVSEEEDGLHTFSPCTQMPSVTNAMCSVSSTEGETRNKAHLFRSSMDWTEGKKHTKKRVQYHFRPQLLRHEHPGSPPLSSQVRSKYGHLVPCYRQHSPGVAC